MSEDNPGVIVRPPLLYLGTLLGGAILDWLWPVSFGQFVTQIALGQIIGGAMALVGAIIMAAAMRRFRRAGTNVPTDLPVTVLVTDGIYGFTRNPIYLGMSCVYAGLSLLFDNPWALALLLPVLIVMRFGVIQREERYLEAKFGELYVTYRGRVRRWL